MGDASEGLTCSLVHNNTSFVRVRRESVMCVMSAYRYVVVICPNAVIILS